MMPSDPTFDANKRALERFAPRVAACLARFPGEPAEPASEGGDANEPPPDLHSRHVVVVWGLGDGCDVARILDSTPAAVVVLERRPAACIRAFHGADFSAAIESGRLRLFMIPAARPLAQEISLRECMAELVASLHRPGCALRFLSPRPASPAGGFYQALRSGVEDAARRVEEFGAARAAQAAFDITVVSPSCAIFDDLAQCFSRLGLKVQLMRVPDRRGVWSAEQVRAAQRSLATQPSRLVVSRNRALFEASSPTAYPQPEALIPGCVATWWWDVPNVATHLELRQPRGNARAFAFARDILARLPQGAEWLPPGARTPFVEAGAQPEPDRDLGVSFVGQSRLKGLHTNIDNLRQVLGDLGAGAPALAQDLERFGSYERLHGYLTGHEADIREAIGTLRPAFPAHAYYLQYLLDMAITAAFRIAAIERLLKDGIEVALYGDADWLKVPGVTAAGFKGVCPHGDLPALYRRSRINLNLNFMQVSSTVNPKVLDIAAAGGVALTDFRPELESLYPDPAVRPFVFDALGELTEKVLTLEQMDLSRHRQVVREHTCAHHTLQHRAHWLAGHFGLVPQA